jgi:hypothetical protein
LAPSAEVQETVALLVVNALNVIVGAVGWIGYVNEVLVFDPTPPTTL